MSATILVGDALATLRGLPDGSARCCVTSPPYWGLRDYGVPGQLGMEPSPTSYVSVMVEVFREVRRVLADDGTLWLNLGDSYSSGGRTTHVADTARGQVVDNKRRPKTRNSDSDPASGKAAYLNGTAVRPGVVEGLAGKQLIGIPWRVAFALQDDGWILRCDIVWQKPNPMPESVRDRPTKSHEYLFLLSKGPRYYYDADAIAEPATCPDKRMIDGFVPKSVNGKHVDDPQNAARRTDKQRGHGRRHAGFNDRWDAMEKAEQCSGTRNARSVWKIATSPYRDAHFATFPPELPRRCILAGSEPGDTVLDPFVGAGTTLLVADRLGRNGLGIELNPKYAAMARRRIAAEAPLFHVSDRVDEGREG